MTKGQDLYIGSEFDERNVDLDPDVEDSRCG